jgi:hypothetical protein
VTGEYLTTPVQIPTSAPAQATVPALPDGDWGLRLDVGATGRDGTTFSVPYYFRVVVGS